MKKNKVFEFFAGEYVMVTIDKEFEISKQERNTVSTQRSLLSITGFLTEEDDDYFYLGYQQNTITHAIKKSLIVQIEVGQEHEEDIMSEVLNGFDIPTGNNNAN